MDFDKIAQSLSLLLGGKGEHRQCSTLFTAYGWYWLTTHLPINTCHYQIDGVKGCFRNSGKCRSSLAPAWLIKFMLPLFRLRVLANPVKQIPLDSPLKNSTFQRIARLLSFNIFVPIILPLLLLVY